MKMEAVTSISVSLFCVAETWKCGLFTGGSNTAVENVVLLSNEEQFICCAVRDWDVNYYHNTVLSSGLVLRECFACASVIGSIDPVYELWKQTQSCVLLHTEGSSRSQEVIPDHSSTRHIDLSLWFDITPFFRAHTHTHTHARLFC